MTTSSATARARRRLLLGSFLLLTGVFALTNSGRFHVIDEYETFFMAKSLLERGAVDMPQVAGSEYFFGRVGQDGRLYSPYGVGQPILTVPFLMLGAHAAHFLPKPRIDPDFWLWFFSTLSSALFSALAVVLFQAWLLRRGLAPARVLWAGLLLGLGTIIWVYAGQYRSGTYLMMVFAAILLATEFRGQRAGLLLFSLALLAVLLRVDAILGVTLLAVYRASLPGGSRSARGMLFAVSPLLIGLLVGMAIILYLNFSHFGDPFQTAYPDCDDIGRPANQLGLPSWIALTALLVSPGKGLLVFCPLVALSLLRLPVFLARHRREGVLVIGMALSYLVFFSCWQHYEGGWCFGPRFLVPVTPFLLLPLVFFPMRRVFLIPAALAGACVSFLGLAVNFLGVAQAENYYENLTDGMRALAYNVWHSPLPTHVVRLGESLRDLALGVEFDKQPGYGLDFWWAFAVKEGIPNATILAIAGIWLLMIAAGIALLRCSNSEGVSEKPDHDVSVNLVDYGVVTR
jgi:hypothetical protein